MNKLLLICIPLIVVLVVFSAYQTTQLEIVKSELATVQQHYSFALDTLKFFMDSTDKDEGLREESKKKKKYRTLQDYGL